MDPRHKKRIKIVQNLFASTFETADDKREPPHTKDKISPKISANIEVIDKTIAQHAPKYPIDKIAKIDLSILRLAVYELLIDKNQPEKVVINEAVELAKELGNERSYAFINAVLGSIVKEK